jgi:hypothetical protein
MRLFEVKGMIKEGSSQGQGSNNPLNPFPAKK